MAQSINDICDGCREVFIRDSFNQPSKLDLWIFTTTNAESPNYKYAVNRELCKECVLRVAAYIQTIFPKQLEKKV